METFTKTQITFSYISSGDEYRIIISDHEDNNDYIRMVKGEEELTLPKEVIESFCKVLSNFKK